ncbi:hypothetical protein KFK09_018500 [Dendrobium nobile]|uniref:TF-B3 domain-containing protein n=1 Tax=Dendrobium nobile TaxID=94219 RepID=A0A8T3AWA0_DENNO|nr:hypothetical protein KFK09_018500 [Dendrobium nobile]
MEESCWFCKKWEQHYYWDHLKLTNHRFMKVMLKDFSQGMAIPKHFVENFKGELSETINLEVSTGKLWQFNLQKTSGSFVIVDGWKEFVDDHGIKEGEYLVFTCSGNSRFQVQIFDNGACLRDASHSPVENAKTVAKERCQKQNENCYSSHSSKNFYTTGKSKAKQASGHKLSSIRKKRKIGILSDEATQPNRKSSYVYRSSKLAMHCFEQETLEAKKLKSKKRSIDFDAIKPESPYFIRLMKHTAVNVLFFMAIPAVFFTKHFSHKPETITLHNHQGKKWDVICSYHCFSWGFKGETWKTFVRENYLKVGDACVFELKAFTRKNTAMTVRIVRATDEDLV